MDLVFELLNGNTRALARAISLVENGGVEKEALLGSIFHLTGKAMVVGITGSPGAGKSSLVDKLIGELRANGASVGVLAVDPTSPFTGGALLGDRIRMQEHVLDKDVFIRSMGTRGSLGGLARATREAIKILDAFGKDVILVETVGVGQSELDVMHTVDTTVVVLTPGAGDVVQTMKAGIMEIADIFAVNKADMEGADRLAVEIENMLDLGQSGPWRPPVVKTVSLTGQGVGDLYQALTKHWAYLRESGLLEKKREQRLRGEVFDLVVEELRQEIDSRLENKGMMDELLARVISREINPYVAADRILSELRGARKYG
ncbi:MAG: methylmalonyl Co-A mutase-associated GTPase MeaB [Clostridia bacterium]|nr:MAG: methylmalonyl Co-A mutase-associated GTPase MeaB [Clostridia bacterium]